MKIIFIRGVPGTGKTLISEILGKITFNSKIICVDTFKIQEMKKGSSFKHSQKIAYKKTIQKLEDYFRRDIQTIIVEEILFDKEFYGSLKEFISKNRCGVSWFRIMRPLKTLLEVEKNRKRKVKNTPKDFLEIRESINCCKIEQECVIKNDNLMITIREILNQL